LSEAAQEKVVEHDDHWALPLADREVTQCRLDSEFSLVFSEPERADVVVRFGAFQLREPIGTEHSLDPQQAGDDLGPALALLRQTVSRAVAWRDGRLQIDFTSGASLEVRPDPDYEAWEVSGPGAICLVCVPGGGQPAIWG
jgi:hypothetical protein